LHDGQNCFDGATSFIPNQEWRADETAESLIRGGLIQPVIMVAIDNAGAERGNEFLPTQRVPRGGLQPMGGKADLYGKFITDEVLPFINREYRTNPDPQVTGMIGSSLGGIITLHLGLTLGRFTRLGVVSPSVWWDDRMILRTVNGIPTSKRLRVWIDMGTREGNQAVEDARLLRGAFLSRGFQLGSNLAYYEDVGAEHNEKAWAGRFGMILMFLYGKNSP
jgi:predicted alpha/beta superfamily hydrolase